MKVRLSVEDDMSGNTLKMELAEDTSVDEIIETVADHWKKPQGAYVLRWQNALLRGNMTIDAAGIRDDERLVLMADPEGG